MLISDFKDCIALAQQYTMTDLDTAIQQLQSQLTQLTVTQAQMSTSFKKAHQNFQTINTSLGDQVAKVESEELSPLQNLLIAQKISVVPLSSKMLIINQIDRIRQKIAYLEKSMDNNNLQLMQMAKQMVAMNNQLQYIQNEIQKMQNTQSIIQFLTKKQVAVSGVTDRDMDRLFNDFQKGV